MSAEIVVNTGPLITLAKIDGLDVVGKLPFRFLCPQEVRDELSVGVALGYPKIEPRWLKTAKLISRPTPLSLSALDLGESAVIHLALEREISWVCIDEWKARRAALGVGLKVVGVLGLLSMAKRLRIIDAVSPFVNRATAGGIRYHSDLVNRVLEAVGEK